MLSQHTVVHVLLPISWCTWMRLPPGEHVSYLLLPVLFMQASWWEQCLLSHRSSDQEVQSNLAKWFCLRDTHVFVIKMLVQSHLQAWPGQVFAGSLPWQEASSVSWGIHGRSSCWLSWAGAVQPEATVALVTAASLLGCLLCPSASLSLCAAHFLLLKLICRNRLNGVIPGHGHFNTTSECGKVRTTQGSGSQDALYCTGAASGVPAL